MAKIFPIDFEEKNTIACWDFILFSDSEDWDKIKKAQYSNLKGEKWDTWTAATITVGSTTTWAAWTCACVNNSWTQSAAVLDFTIPKWDKWDTWQTWPAIVSAEFNWNDIDFTEEDGNVVTLTDAALCLKWDAATVDVGCTTTLCPWCSASVVNSWTQSAAVFDFSIPKGDKWDSWAAATITVWNTCTLAPWCSATVNNSGSSSAAVFDFGIPKGEKGDTGCTWPQWPSGTISVWTTSTLCPWCDATVTNTWTCEAAIFNFWIPKWEKWDTWATGSAATVNVWTTATLPAWCCATVSNTWTCCAAVLDFGIPTWDKGDTWSAATIAVGTTTTLNPWCSATVSNSWTSWAAIFNFWIPKGCKWDTGTAATITVWTTTTWGAWTCASVTNSWTSSAAVLNFTIPKWDKGDTWCTWSTWPAGNWIANVTSTKAWKETTVDITCTNGCSYCFVVCDWEDGEWAWDVLWPASSTDGHVVLFDGNSWKLIKDSWKSLPSVINCLCSTSTTDALSAAQGKELKDALDNISWLGKFLSLWNSATWQPISFPLSTPYTYTTWDWFMVEIVWTTNYKPTWSSYTGSASTVVESWTVKQWDVYIYDGTDWLLQVNNEPQVSFSEIAWEPTDNACLCAALDAKQDNLTAWANINITSNKVKATNVYTVKESDTCTTYTGTKWVAPYNTCYCYTNICINPDSWVEWHEWGIYSFDIDAWMVATSACRNVRVKIWDGTYIPVMWTSSILAWHSYFTKANTRQYMYSTKYINTWALHLFTDSNTTYSAIGTAEIDTWTCTSARSISAANLKYAITHYAPISDTAYWSGWDGSTTAPTQNAVYDKIQSVVGSIPTVPTNVSAFCNDSWYLTWTTWVCSVNGCTGTVTLTIPTDNCQLANGCWYITSAAVPTDNCQLSNGCGYIKWISCGDVTSALWFTPYSSANPNWYTTCTGTLSATNTWCNGQVLTKTSSWATWCDASWWDVKVSTQTCNILTTWMKIWAWCQCDYDNLGTYDWNTVYLTI